MNSLLEPVTNEQRFEITQDTIILCVTSDIKSTQWFYRGSSENGIDGDINGSSSVSVDKSELVTKGVVKLIVKYPLLASDAGFYSCKTYETYLNSSAGLVTHLVELVALGKYAYSSHVLLYICLLRTCVFHLSLFPNREGSEYNNNNLYGEHDSVSRDEHEFIDTNNCTNNDNKFTNNK